MGCPSHFDSSLSLRMAVFPKYGVSIHFDRKNVRSEVKINVMSYNLYRSPWPLGSKQFQKFRIC